MKKSMMTAVLLAAMSTVNAQENTPATPPAQRTMEMSAVPVQDKRLPDLAVELGLTAEQITKASHVNLTFAKAAGQLKKAGLKDEAALDRLTIPSAIEQRAGGHGDIATTFDWDHRTPTAWQLFMNKAFRKLRLPMRLTPAPSDMANVEARMNLFHLLEQVIAYKVPGDIVDLGCNAGDSTIVMQKVVSALVPERQVHAFDSFEGLPELTGTDVADGVYGKGYMAAPLDLFKRKFDALGLKQPHIHKGWFQDTVPQGLPDRIAFALIDGDLYESTKHVLPHVYARMAPGASA